MARPELSEGRRRPLPGSRFGSGSLAADASTGEIQLRPSKTDWSNSDEADDYRRAADTAFTDAHPPPTGARPRLGRGAASRPGPAEAARYLDRWLPPLAATAAALPLTAASMLTGVSHVGTQVDGDLVRGTEP
ncbi:hypothetical protein [Streptomyces sp. NBC_00063]|uniref:hypothetical protein n=1 Tax=Streptomyces sp. NBC_00063 TaxID=2975638 RepID=UPI003D76586F